LDAIALALTVYEKLLPVTCLHHKLLRIRPMILHKKTPKQKLNTTQFLIRQAPTSSKQQRTIKISKTKQGKKNRFISPQT
jgi:hypothetical protein